MKSLETLKGLARPKAREAPRLSRQAQHHGLLERTCTCGNRRVTGDGCNGCIRKKAWSLQAELEISRPGDIYEQEADQIANLVSAPAAHQIVSDASPHLQRREEQHGENVEATHASVHRALASAGSPLEPRLRLSMERRFGYDFSRVRVHTGAAAEQSAREVNAHAYTVGQEIVFAPGRFAPGTHEGRRLLAHELTHVVQGRIPSSAPASSFIRLIGARPRLGRATVELSRAAIYPTAGEQGRIQEILNPQQQEAAEAGTSVAPVTDPDGFMTEMTDRMTTHIDQALPSARARQESGIVLDVPELTALANIAQPAVTTYYGAYLRAAVHRPAEQAARAAYRLREHIHEVPTTLSAQTDHAALDWVASRMRKIGGDLQRQYHVVAGDPKSRDQHLFDSVRNHIFRLRTADLRTIILYHGGYEGGGEAYVQRHVDPREYAGQSTRDIRRRGRWEALATTIHEMLHAVAHEDFQTAARALEESGVAVEGFAQYFTLPVYESLTERAASDASLRALVEGVTASFLLPPDAKGYERYVERVTEIRDILGGNEENLKVAYFLGRIEYLGLGGWNRSEAARRRYPANTLGVAVLLTDNGQGFFRIHYGRVLLGRDEPFQLQLGGTLNYLAQGDRLGLGGTIALQYSWPQVFVRAGLDVAATASVALPFASSVRLDLLPGVETGVRIGVARVGAGAFLLIPVTGGPVSERTVHLAAGLGASFEF